MSSTLPRDKSQTGFGKRGNYISRLIGTGLSAIIPKQWGNGSFSPGKNHQHEVTSLQQIILQILSEVCNYASDRIFITGPLFMIQLIISLRPDGNRANNTRHCHKHLCNCGPWTSSNDGGLSNFRHDHRCKRYLSQPGTYS